MKKNTKFKKYHSDKLFNVLSISRKSTICLDIGGDVRDFAYLNLNYDLTNPKQLESFLRKCFRAYVAEIKT